MIVVYYHYYCHIQERRRKGERERERRKEKKKKMKVNVLFVRMVLQKVLYHDVKSLNNRNAYYQKGKR